LDGGTPAGTGALYVAEGVAYRPDNSYRNILRAGFAEDAVTANWLGRA